MSNFYWPSELVIVRHGESERNLAQAMALNEGLPRYGDSIRQVDTPLTQRGWQQAEATADFLATKPPFHRVIVSPYLRTIQTAEAIMKKLPYESVLRIEERVRERESGIFDGYTPAGLEEKYPDEWARRLREGRYYYRAPGGESYPDVNLRVYSFLNSMKHNFAGKSILVISHSLVVWSFRRVIARLGEQELLELLDSAEEEVCNCSVTSFSGEEGAKRMVLKEFGAVHYPPEIAVNERCRKRSAIA